MEDYDEPSGQSRGACMADSEYCAEGTGAAVEKLLHDAVGFIDNNQLHNAVQSIRRAMKVSRVLVTARDVCPQCVHLWDQHREGLVPIADWSPDLSCGCCRRIA